MTYERFLNLAQKDELTKADFSFVAEARESVDVCLRAAFGLSDWEICDLKATSAAIEGSALRAAGKLRLYTAPTLEAAQYPIDLPAVGIEAGIEFTAHVAGEFLEIDDVGLKDIRATELIGKKGDDADALVDSAGFDRSELERMVYARFVGELNHHPVGRIEAEVSHLVAGAVVLRLAEAVWPQHNARQTSHRIADEIAINADTIYSWLRGRAKPACPAPVLGVLLDRLVQSVALKHQKARDIRPVFNQMRQPFVRRYEDGDGTIVLHAYADPAEFKAWATKTYGPDGPSFR